MQRALFLAQRGFGKTQPNPIVGAVVVRDGRVVGDGYHARVGGAHAEIMALRSAGKLARGATVYVTLDPCCHTGRTPPCTEALVAAGVVRVVSAVDDPNDIAHRGEAFLRKNGVYFSRGLCRDEAIKSHQFFRKLAKRRLPYVFAKAATTLDGKMAMASGSARGITSESALRYVHQLRSYVDAILIGSGTAVADNPHLGVRHVRGREPMRVLLDSELSVPFSATLYRDANVCVFTTRRASAARLNSLQSKGIFVHVFSKNILLPEVLHILYERGIYLLLVEAGPKLLTAFFEAKLVDASMHFIAPKLLGGAGASTPYEGKGAASIAKATPLLYPEVHLFPPDVLISGFLKWY